LPFIAEEIESIDAISVINDFKVFVNFICQENLDMD
jgi:hypothetical protein